MTAALYLGGVLILILLVLLHIVLTDDVQDAEYERFDKWRD